MRMHSAGRAVARQGQRGFVHILLVVLVTFGITVYGFLPSLEEALVSERRHEEKRLRDINDAKRILGGYAMKGPGDRGADLTEEGGAGLRRYLMPCPDLPLHGSARDGVGEANCQDAPSTADEGDLLGDDWLTAPLEDLGDSGGRAGFLPEQVLNPYDESHSRERLLHIPPDSTSSPLYLVSRNVVREDRPLNPTRLARLPLDWLRLDMSRYDTATSSTVTYDLEARIAFMVIAPGAETGDPCTSGAGPRRNTPAQRITDWTSLFLTAAGGPCDYPPLLRLDDGDGTFPRTEDRVAYLSVEQLLTGGSGNMEDLEESAAELDRIIRGETSGLGIQQALEGYYQRHGFFPDPAAFDIGLGTSPYQINRGVSTTTTVVLAGIPHSDELLRTGGIDSTVAELPSGETIEAMNINLGYNPNTDAVARDVLKTRKKRVRVNLPEELSIDLGFIDEFNLNPPYSTYPLDPGSRADFFTNRAYSRIPATLPPESAYRSAEPLGLQPRAPDIFRGDPGHTLDPIESDHLLANLTVSVPRTIDYGSSANTDTISALRVFRSHMEMVSPPGMQLFARAGEAALLVPDAAMDLSIPVAVTVTVENPPGSGMYEEDTVPYNLPSDDVRVRSHDGGVIDYELEADLIGIQRTPIDPAAPGELRNKPPLPRHAPIRPGNKGLLPVDSILGDLPSQLDPDRDVAAPKVNLNLFCQDGSTATIVMQSETGDCPPNLGPLTDTALMEAAGASSGGVALRMVTATEMGFVAIRHNNAPTPGVVVEAFPYLASDGSVDAFRSDHNPTPFRIPELNLLFGDAVGGTAALFSSPLVRYQGADFPFADAIDIGAETFPVQFRLPAGTQLVLRIGADEIFIGKEFDLPGMYAVVPAGTRVPGRIAPDAVRPDGRRNTTADFVVEEVQLPRGGIVHFNNAQLLAPSSGNRILNPSLPGMNRAFINPSGRTSYSEVVSTRQRRNLGFEVMGEGLTLSAGSTMAVIEPGCTVLPYRPAWYCSPQPYELTSAGHALHAVGSAMEMSARGTGIPPVYRAPEVDFTVVGSVTVTTSRPGDIAYRFDSANNLGSQLYNNIETVLLGVTTTMTGLSSTPDIVDLRALATATVSVALARPDFIADESTRVIGGSGSRLEIGYGTPTGFTDAFPDPFDTEKGGGPPVVLNDYFNTRFGYALYMATPPPTTVTALTAFRLDHMRDTVVDADGGYLTPNAVAAEFPDFEYPSVISVTMDATTTMTVSTTPATLTMATLLLEPGMFRQATNLSQALTLTSAMRSNFTAVPYSDLILTGVVSTGAIITVVRAGMPIDILAAGADGQSREVRVRSLYGGGAVRHGLDGDSQRHARPRLRPHYEMVGVLRQDTMITIAQPHTRDLHEFNPVTLSRFDTIEGLATMTVGGVEEPVVTNGFSFEPAADWIVTITTVTEPGAVTTTAETTLSVVTVDLDLDPTTVRAFEAARQPST